MAKIASQSSTRVTKTVDSDGKKIGYSSCAVCGGRFPTIEMDKIDSLWHCKICGDIRKKEIATNIALRNFLYKICGEDEDSMPFLMHQVKQLKDYNGWKGESILAVLEYVFDEDSNITYNPQYGILGLVERYYPIVKDFYIGKRNLNGKFPEEEIMEILAKPPRIITMKRSQLIKQEEEYNEKKKNIIYGPPINLDDIPDTEYDENNEEE